jgi:hypothetical protein
MLKSIACLPLVLIAASAMGCGQKAPKAVKARSASPTPTIVVSGSPVTETWQPTARRTDGGWQVLGLPTDVPGTPAVHGNTLAWNSMSRLFVMDLQSGKIQVAVDAGAYPKNQPLALINQPAVSERYLLWTQVAPGYWPSYERVCALDLTSGQKTVLSKSARSPTVFGSTAAWIHQVSRTQGRAVDRIETALLPGGARTTVARAINAGKLALDDRYIGWLEYGTRNPYQALRIRVRKLESLRTRIRRA